MCALAGGIIAGSCAQLMVHPSIGIVLGGCMGIGSVLLSRVWEALQRAMPRFLWDTSGVFFLHGVAGLISAVIGAIVTGSYQAEGVRDGIHGVPFFQVFGAENEEQAQAQWATMFISLGIAFGGGLFTGLAMRYLPGLRHRSLKEVPNFTDHRDWKTPRDFVSIITASQLKGSK